MFVSPANAAAAQRFSIEQLSQELSLRISNTADHVSLTSTIYVTGAELSTTSVVGTGVTASPGQIFLTFSASTSPVPLNYGQANWGHFFSAMRPLTPTAVSFRSIAGQRYAAHESDPVSQANNPNVTTDDGLLDATYWFLVPINTRSGTILIGPATTVGTEFNSFVGQSTTALQVSGPVAFRVSFPSTLSTTTVRHPKISTTLPTTNTAMNVLLSVLGLTFLAPIFWIVRRRKRRRVQ